MNEQQIEDIKNALREMMQIIVQRGEPLSNELKTHIAQVMEHAATRITDLRRQPEPEAEQAERQIPNLGAPPSADAQLLWILAGQNPNTFVQYLNEYPSAETRTLLSNPDELRRNIDYLARMMPQGEPPVIDGIQHSELNSSTIWGSNYDDKTGKMKVRFQGGAEYEYDGVPKNIYDAFSRGEASAKTSGQNQYGKWWENKNPSAGAAMNQYIKQGGFPYRRLN